MSNSPTSSFSISKIAIRRHIGTLMLTLCAIAIGIFLLFNLQVDLLPSITYPRIGVRLNVPGVSPEVAIDEVTRPLEEALSATEGVVQVYSQTREGRVSLDLYFQPGGNIDRALNDATAAFNRARSNLPEIVEEPRLFKIDPSQLPVYELALASPSLKPVDLRVFADQELAREFGVIPGVASVNVTGGVREEVRIIVDFNRLQALGIGLNDVLNELRNSNQDISGGRILGEFSEPLTRAVGKFKNVDEIANLSFQTGSDSNRRVYLRDFAKIIDGTEEQRIFVTLNNQSAVKVSVQKQPDANTIQVVENVKKRIEELRASGIIPKNMEAIATTDESIFIRNAIGNVTSSGLMGTGLAAIAVLLFLGSLRQTLIIVISIPLATLAAISLMKLFGLSLNVFSLGGLALGVGIVVDNSIVMLETIAEDAGMVIGQDSRARLSSKELLNKAVTSSQSVESALLASTATNLVAVLPFLLIGGFIALLFNELILTISFAVAASILVAVTVVPMLASRVLAIPSSSKIGKFWFLGEFNRRFQSATDFYRSILDRVLKQGFWAILVTFLLLGGSSFQLLKEIPQEILPRIDTGQAQLNAQFPPGTPLATSRKVMNAVEEILLKQPETAYVFSTVGGSLFGNATTTNPLRASSTITLKPNTDVENYTTRVSQEFRKLNLVDIRLRLNPGQVRGLIVNNSPVRSDLDLMLQGENSEKLEQFGEEVLQVLEKEATLASFRSNVDSRQSEIQIRLDRERAGDLKLNIQDIGNVIRTAIEGSVPTQLQRNNRLVDIRVRLDRDSLQTPSQLSELPIFTENNRLIRLASVATIEEAKAPGEIERINQRQVFLIAGSLNKGASLGEAFAEMEAILAKIEFPQGISRLPSAAAQSNRDIQAALPVLGGLAGFLVFVVMAVQYNSLIDPLVIMFTLPLALAGGIWGLYMTQTAIGATVIVGTVLLVGIVVNNAIIMVELANQIREREGVSRRVAILQAAPQRLRAILMTTITTVVGMFPLALGLGQGGEFLQPLGIVVFSGLSVATLLTLFIIPCFYLLLHDLSDSLTKAMLFSTEN
jgi:multidrug efflux pump subunit AcrB